MVIIIYIYCCIGISRIGSGEYEEVERTKKKCLTDHRRAASDMDQAAISGKGEREYRSRDVSPSAIYNQSLLLKQHSSNVHENAYLLRSVFNTPTH